MQFLHETDRNLELTYNEVFIVPQHNATYASRTQADLTPLGDTGLMMPLVGANMNSLAGKRSSEVLARFGGIGTLTQDMDTEHLITAIDHVKSAHPSYEAALTITGDMTIGQAKELMWKRSYKAAVVMRDDEPISVLTMEECESERAQEFDKVDSIMSGDLVSMPPGLSPEQMFNRFTGQGPRIYPVVDGGQLLGVMTRQAAFDLINFKPAVDSKGRLMVGAAIGINGNPAAKAEQLLDLGVDMLVVDTANGGLELAMQAVKKVRRVIDASRKKIPLAAGNVVTGELAVMLYEHGANIVKVGVGPGAMCTTRMMTGVGRPQFSAVLECAEALREASHDKAFVWADGGAKYPRDIALALGAGAMAFVVGTWFVGTPESAGDVKHDEDGRHYVETHGMGSRAAVLARGAGVTALERMQRQRFDEGQSGGRKYLQPGYEGLGQIINQIDAGVRSAFSYTGARTAEEFRRDVIIGVQGAAGFSEGQPVPVS
jgi:GMP reductase